MSTQYMRDVMEAYDNGAKIEFSSRDGLYQGQWFPAPRPDWNWEHSDYRIKPKPTPKPGEVWKSETCPSMIFIFMVRNERVHYIEAINEWRGYDDMDVDSFISRYTHANEFYELPTLLTGETE